MTALVMTDILPAKRAAWAERFLVLALWCQAAAEAKQRAKARDVVLVAHAVAGDEPLNAIPVMSMIAANTVRATLLGGW
jgi:ABC-type iron transport system FetAB permease component